LPDGLNMERVSGADRSDGHTNHMTIICAGCQLPTAVFGIWLVPLFAAIMA
jgi:hypothetical protein